MGALVGLGVGVGLLLIWAAFALPRQSRPDAPRTTRLTRLLAQRARWSWVPLAVASVLFGLVHASGGPVLIAVAALAGVGYGTAYAMTGRIEAAVIAHFTLNSLHFIAFTYPYAAR